MHAGAVIVPAVLAACERHNPDGRMALIGIAVGTEVLCRLSLVVPKAVHKAGFHPTAVFGAMGAAAGVGAALGLNARQIVDALGIAGSMAGGIIEYLAEGAWTKRLHAGGRPNRASARHCWRAAGSSARARCSRACTGCSTVLRTPPKGDYGALTGDFGTRWVTERWRSSPIPAGRWRSPISIARDGSGARHQARRMSPRSSARSRRERCTGCGSRSPTSSARATAMPPSSRRPICCSGSCMAASGSARSRKARSGWRVLALAAKVKFVIDPDNPYPNNYTGHIRATLGDGSVVEERQPHMRGGAQEPLTRQE